MNACRTNAKLQSDKSDKLPHTGLCIGPLPALLRLSTKSCMLIFNSSFCCGEHA